MLKIINSLRGNVEIEITGAYPQDFLNKLSEAGVEFWDIKRVSDFSIRIKMFIPAYKRSKVFAKRAMCRLRLISKNGLPFKSKQIRRRRVLLLGGVLCLALLLILPRFVWSFSVEGNESIPEERILQALEELGIGVGTPGLSIDSQSVKHQMLLKIPELSWISINVSGGKAAVLVRERLPKPEMADETRKSNIIAGKTGLIVSMDVLSGEALVKKGEMVLMGETLIRGELESAPNIKRGRAMGEIHARTWYSLEAVVPAVYTAKSYTGREKSKSYLVFGNKRINLYLNSGIPFDNYDKIVSTSSLSLPGGLVFPLSLSRELCGEYEKAELELDEGLAAELLEQYLTEEVSGGLVGGQIIRSSFTARNEGGLITVRGVFECQEQIGLEVPMQ